MAVKQTINTEIGIPVAEAYGRPIEHKSHRLGTGIGEPHEFRGLTTFGFWITQADSDSHLITGLPRPIFTEGVSYKYDPLVRQDDQAYAAWMAANPSATQG